MASEFWQQESKFVSPTSKSGERIPIESNEKEADQNGLESNA